MKSFQEEKLRIKNLFSGREGFTDQVLDAITATYRFLKEKYPQSFKDSDIPDVKTFKLRGVNGERTIANIFINRIYNNVQKVVFTNKSEFDAKKKLINIESDISSRMMLWDEKIHNEKDAKVAEQLIRAKLIVHELIHAGSDNGVMTGLVSSYSDSSAGKRIALKDKSKNIDINAISEKLEETITEVLALNIVESNHLTGKGIIGGVLVCRNPESSNYSLNPFAEYFLRIYPECVEGKFVDGLSWNNSFQQEVLSKWKLGSVKSHMFQLNNWLQNITAKKDQFNTISYFQEVMLNDYSSKLEISSKEDLDLAIKNYVACKLFAVVGPDGKLDKGVNSQLEKIKSVISEKAESFGVSRDELKSVLISENRRLKSSDGQKEIFWPPYKSQINEGIDNSDK